jgi:hypothetical protein
VYNDDKVRRRCLDRSIEDLRAQAPETEYLPVDNTGRQFATAGAALNHGASQARHEVVAFVHQDVYLHSLEALEHAAGWLRDEQIGVLGAVGITADGRMLGRMRDRVILLGEAAPEPVDVDSLDEVLFLIRRDLVRQQPLSSSPRLAWHAYAVEYGVRMGALGLRAAAIDIPHTHNSMTTNLARLDDAHRAIAELYPDRLPVRTTCGVVGAPRRSLPGEAVLRPHRWRYRWLRGSLATHRLRSATGLPRWVLGDIRMDVDELLALVPDPPLRVVSHNGRLEFTEPADKPLGLVRGSVAVELSSGDSQRLLEAAEEARRGASVLLTNLDASVLGLLGPAVAGQPSVAGWDQTIGAWLVLGPAAELAPPMWTARRGRPLAAPR